MNTIIHYCNLDLLLTYAGNILFVIGVLYTLSLIGEKLLKKLFDGL